MRRGAAIFILIGLFFVFVISGVVYFLSLENTRTSETTDVSVVSGVLPQGVRIIEKEGSRILRDERAGYEMELPEEISAVVGRDNAVLFYSDSSIPDYGTVLGGIGIFDRDNLSLEDWVARLHKETFLVFYEERERIDRGDLEIIKIKMDGPGEPYDYFVLHKDKIINVSWVTGDYLDTYIQNIVFMN